MQNMGVCVEGLVEPVNEAELSAKADNYFDKALLSQDVALKNDYLKQAQNGYYTLSNLERGNIYPVIQLARINDLLHNDKYAKAYFMSALGMDNKNVDANYYFGNFYFDRKNYRLALKYYRKSLENGLKQNSDMLLKMALIYEKLGDLSQSSKYYKKAFLLNPNSEEIPDKIRSLEKNNYKNTGYYKRTNK